MTDQLLESKSLEGNTEAPLEEKKLINVDNLDQTGTETLLAILTTKTYQEAAERLQMTYQGLWLRINKYKLDDIVAQFPKQALMRLQLSSTKAAEKLVEKLEDRRDGLNAATEILDRVGLSGDKGKTLQQFNVNGEMSLEFVEK